MERESEPDAQVPEVHLTVYQRRYQAIDLHGQAPIWPSPMPELQPAEAISAAKRLYRLGVGRAFKGKVVLTSGNRHTWTYQGELRVNASAGWKRLVHDLSHLAHRKLHPSSKPHDWRHAAMEKKMIQAVLEKGWLEGALRRQPKPPPAPDVLRHQRTVEAIARWETKAKRAETALKKLRRRLKYYERRQAA